MSLQIGLFYGSTTCYTEIVAEKIQQAIGEDIEDNVNKAGDKVKEGAEKVEKGAEKIEKEIDEEIHEDDH